MPTMAKVILQNQEAEILIDGCWGMTYLTDGGEERITDLLATGVVNRLIELLSHPMIAITIPCLRIIGNISTASDEQSMIPL